MERSAKKKVLATPKPSPKRQAAKTVAATTTTSRKVKKKQKIESNPDLGSQKSQVGPSQTAQVSPRQKPAKYTDFRQPKTEENPSSKNSALTNKVEQGRPSESDSVLDNNPWIGSIDPADITPEIAAAQEAEQNQAKADRIKDLFKWRRVGSKTYRKYAGGK